MKSPFPGVDPYVESQYFWRDFHATFINYCREALNDKLPENYEARIDEFVHLMEEPFESAKGVLPDVGVERHGPGTFSPAGESVTATLTTLEPVTIPLMMLDKEEEGYIEIRRRPDRELITVLELLSPTNKAGSGRGEYLAKRDNYLHQDVHVVELDLLKEGQRLPMRKPLPPGDFYAFVARADRRPNCEVYTWTVRHPLPTIPIPLKAPDPDILLDLGSVYAVAFERGRYARSIDYGKPPALPFDEGTLRWITEKAASKT